MRIGMVGCGKLGFPVALAWASKGHEVVGYDLREEPKQIMSSRQYPHLEPGCQRLLDQGVSIKMVDTMAQVVGHSDLVFIAVETPHGPEYEGITRMPQIRKDFSYKALVSAVTSVVQAAGALRKPTTIVIISTTLPGTCEREIIPLLSAHTSLVYAPMFIAQSTVVEDALNPEFVLLGVSRADARARELAHGFFWSMHPKEKLRFMSVTSAELTKVAYNVFLGLKIVAANSVMEIAHKTGANCDDVMSALEQATDRIVSPRYMRGGMGDGGGCHPRDQIALAWLAQYLGLSFDLFGSMVEAREAQTDWLANMCYVEAVQHSLPVVVLGKAYKRGTNLTTGSPALLLTHLFGKNYPIEQWDPYIDEPRTFDKPAVFFVGTDHDQFYSMSFPPGSVVIDPWGKMPERDDGVKVIRVGRN